MIDDELADVMERAKVRMTELDKLIMEERAQIVRDYESDIARIAAFYNKTICPNCNGSGCVERLDAPVMRKFGLQPWDGCQKCGGTARGQKGRGYL